MPIEILDFDSAVVERGSATLRNGTWTVETGAEQWSYCLVMPLFNDPATQDARVRIRLAVEVAQGVAEIGFLNRDGSVFRGFESILAGPLRTVTLTTPELRKARSLVVRNADGLGPTRMEFRVVASTRLGASSTVVAAAEFE